MAKRGDVIEQPVTKERITWLETAEETGGAYVRLELAVGPGGFAAAAHIHPHQSESFEILAGQFLLVVDGEERQLGPGDEALVPPGTPHVWRNAGKTEGVMILEFRPALKTEEFFESYYGLAQDGQVDPETGITKQPWLALQLLRYQDDFIRLVDPPLPVVLELFTPIAEEAERAGYRLPYPYPYERVREAAAETT